MLGKHNYTMDYATTNLLKNMPLNNEVTAFKRPFNADIHYERYLLNP
jgi:hypothetical protein